MDQSSPSIPNWFVQLRAGDASAMQDLWEEFSEKLINVAQHRLQGHLLSTAIVEGEDVIASVFESIWEASKHGRLRKIEQVDELLWLLLAMTRRKCIDHLRRSEADRRGKGKKFYSLNDSAAMFSEIVSTTPDPQYAAELNEQYEWILRQLPDTSLRQIAVKRIEGFTIEEISSQMQIAVSTVQRKLKIVRNILRDEIERP